MGKIWFITGASKGFGLVLVRRLLKEGNKVAGTSRDLNALKAAVGVDSPDFLPLSVDLLDEDSIGRAFYDAIRRFGKIDVVVNSAKYGLAGNIEELTDRETRRNFDVNVFGSLNVVRAALPYLREQQSGHIFNITSVGRFTGDAAGFGIYRATELAVLGFSESLAAEVKAFGIKVTTVAPAFFAGNFLSMDSLALPKRRIAGYRPLNKVQVLPPDTDAASQHAEAEKAAEAFMVMAAQDDPPLFFLLGQQVAALKTRTLGKGMNSVKELTARLHV